jgi:hypothetical protein
MAKMWLIIGVALLSALLVGAVTIAVVTTRGGVHFLPADSPEGVVQRYLLALRRGDYTEARGYLSSDLQARCSPDYYPRGYYWPYTAEDQEVTLERVQRYGDWAYVDVKITVFYGGPPFGTSENSYKRSFQLKLEAGQWRLTGPGCALEGY